MAKGKGKAAKPKRVESELDRVFPDLPKDVQDSVHMARGIVRSFGRALFTTIVAANYPAGGPLEDELIEKTDDAWLDLADKVILFALDKEGN